MLLLVRAPQEQVLEVLARGHGNGQVGPTSSSGWTAAWVFDADDDLAIGAPTLAVVEDVEGLTLTIRSAGPEASWTLAVDAGATADPAEVAAALARLFELGSSAAALEPALDSTVDDFEGSEESFAEALAEVLPLPELWGPRCGRAVVAHRGDRRLALLAARLAGPVELTSLDGWSVLVDVEEPCGHLPLAEALVATSPRSAVVVALWRGERGTAGVDVVHRGTLTCKAWGTGWRAFPGVSPDHVVGSLSAAFPESMTGLAELRALCRAASWPTDPLQELARLLDLPAGVLAVLDQQGGTPEARRIGQRRVGSAWWEALRAGEDRGPRPRWWRLLLALGSVLAAAASLSMALLGAWAIRAGAAPGGGPVRTEDRLATAAFVVLTLVLVPTGVWRVRRARS